ncbi:MBL fold metallo-hydrolase [Mesorhizobium sp. BH1-1-5]|uniref:MBL fold metallo-hydrolase n=1 Tax=Mesorhizobium sp. BH1-1-5 TaxID=2876661 RepID=UPI001CCF334F|nr:MBL fold metallo-hydrolase [Mesorhizobium sp. BH1-1-5]MBZ9985815.1 MBL fold metallo-hydrolase [Mesorhizobium sp. BH1-1-5]
MTDEPRKQTSGVYRRRVGDAMITVINDGFLDISVAILRGTERGDMEGLMREQFRHTEPRLTVNAFVIETGKNTVLVDAGGGSTTVYSMGLLPQNLEAAGFKPADFDTVLLTHIHPDHSSGLIDTAGKPLFPRAEIIVHEDDLDFWSDPEKRGKSAAAVPYAGSADALLTTYRGRFRPTNGGDVVPGIRQLPLPGHTPGHSGYQLDSAGETLVMWGDTVHVPEIQIPRPQVTSEFDVDEALAHENRCKIFEHVANERLLVTGGHLHLPGFAHLVKAGAGYRLVPEAWLVQL